MAKTFFINPVTSVRYRGKPASTRRWKASGFSRNRPRTAKAPTKRQLAARKKFAAMARARAAAGRKKVRAHSRSTGEAGMARRKRKAVTRRSPRRRRRVSTARRRVYAANPVRRKRRRGRSVARRSSSRRRYRRNPPGGLVGSLINVGINAGGVVAGRVAYNIAQQQLGAMIASPTDTLTMAQGKKLLVGAGVAVAITMLGRKMGGERGRKFSEFAAAGALSAPMIAFIGALSPTSMTYLGDGAVMAMPRFIGPRNLSAYAGNQGIAAYAGSGMSAYAPSSSQPY